MLSVGGRGNTEDAKLRGGCYFSEGKGVVRTSRCGVLGYLMPEAHGNSTGGKKTSFTRDPG
eukprot:768287-Hanusia_phi.AAC.8